MGTAGAHHPRPTLGRNGTKQKVSLIVPTINGLAPHKTTRRLLQEAKAHGLVTVVGVDSRTTDGTAHELAHLIDTLVPIDNTTCYCEERMNEIVDAVQTPWVFWVCDDELPSAQLWAVAETVYRSGPHIFRPNIVSPLPDWKGVYTPLVTYQPRLFKLDTVRWVPGGLDRLPIRTLPEVDIPEVLWHFNLWATRKSREEKTAAHEAAWLAAWQYHPWPAGSRRAYLFEDYPNDTQPIDPWRKYL